MFGLEGRTDSLSVAETAEKLGVSEKTIYNLIHRGPIPASMVGGSLRVPCDELLVYLKDNLVIPVPEGG